MADVTIIGGGTTIRACQEVLSAAGFELRRTFAVDDRDRSPIILGEIPGAGAIARQAVDFGRHLLIANPSLFPADRLSQLFEGRRKAQALFLWSDRRHHPAYRLLNGLIESDPAWRPRYFRLQTLLTGAPALSQAAWSLVETAAIASNLSQEPASSLSAAAITNPARNTTELITLTIDFAGTRAFLQIGLAEALARSETLVVAGDRRAYVDELNPGAPLRILAEEQSRQSGVEARWISTGAATTALETTRQQCLAFLDGAVNPQRSHSEAMLWTSALAVGIAARQSIAAGGVETVIEPLQSEAPAFRLLA